MFRYDTFLQYTVYTILVAIFLTPSLRIADGLPEVRIEDLIILTAAIYMTCRSLAGQGVRLAWGLRQTLLTMFLPFIFVGNILAGIHGYDVNLSDLNQLIRLTKYIVIYTMAATVIYYAAPPADIRLRVLHLILVVSIILFLIALQQYFDIFGLNRRYVLAIDEYHGLSLVGGGYPRPIGLIGSSQALGFLFAITAVIALHLSFQRGLRWRYLLVFAVNVVGVMLTASRTSLLTCAAGCLVVVAGQLASARRWSRGALFRGISAFTLLLVLSGAAIVDSGFYEQFLWRFAALRDPLEASSFQARLGAWQANLRLFQESPLFGMGMLRAERLPAAHNDWLLLLRIYGIVGTLFLIAAVVVPHVLSRRGPMKLLTSAVLLASAIYMVTEVIFHSLVFMPLVLILIALSDTCLSGKVLR